MTINRSRWLVLICIGVITFMTDLDASIVNVALPVINRALSITTSTSELLVSVYLVAICVLLLPFGKLGDRHGKIRVFKIGTVIFMLGSLACGLSPAIGWLLLARLVQAIGAAMTMSTNNGIITETFAKDERGQALGWIGSFVALGMIAGPGIGGIVLNALPWNWIFYINVPVGILMIIMGELVFAKDAKPATHEPFDWLGNATLAIGITAGFTYLYAGQQLGFANGWLLALLAGAILALISFVRTEEHVANPLINLAIFKNFDFSIGLITAVMTFIINNFYMVLMPFYLESARTITPLVAGEMMMALPVVQIIVAPLAGKLSDRFGTLSVSVVGLAIILLTQGLLATVNAATSLVVCVLMIGLLGLGNAIFQSPNNAMIMDVVTPNQLGVAGSLNSLSRNIGMVSGNAVATSLLFLSMGLITREHVVNVTKNNLGAFIISQQWIYLLGSVLIGISLLGFIIRLIQNQGGHKHD